MFKLTDETRAEIIAILREKFEIPQNSDEQINEVLDEVIDVVKRQFGM
jgi:nucleoid DNA-binding protein